MFRTAFRLPFRLLGIPIHLDITFLIILPFLAWVIGRNIGLYVEMFQLPIDPAPLQEGAMPYLVGLAAALGLFLSILIHELGHSVVGMYYGIRIKNITLWLLGGMAQFERMPRQPGAEAVTALAGPVTSYALAAFCWAVLLSGALPSDFGQFVLTYLAFMNVVLATFNLLPALPLDGGRILRSLLALKMSQLQATEVAGAISKTLAIALGLLGFLTLNIFLMLVAFFIYIAVTGETQMTVVAETLKGIGVREVMTEDVKTVSPDMPLNELVQKMLGERHLGYPVLDGSRRLVGLVNLDQIKAQRRADSSDPQLRVGDVMAQEPARIHLNASALDAFQQISHNAFDRLCVVDDYDNLVGIISKTDLIRVIQVRAAGFPLEGRPEARDAG